MGSRWCSSFWMESKQAQNCSRYIFESKEFILLCEIIFLINYMKYNYKSKNKKIKKAKVHVDELSNNYSFNACLAQESGRRISSSTIFIEMDEGFSHLWLNPSSTFLICLEEKNLWRNPSSIIWLVVVLCYIGLFKERRKMQIQPPRDEGFPGSKGCGGKSKFI